MRVLIVDDSPSNLKLLRAVLEAEGLQVAEAADGVQALAVMEREAIDAVISDILMPRMDGYRLCNEVRKNERLKTLPFIFYSATYTSPSDEKLSYELGGDKYLQKPATVQAILAALMEAADAAGRRPANRAGTLSDADVMQEYSERLVSKLEVKNVQLSEATKKLEETNRRLEQAGIELQKANEDLELRVRQRTAELRRANEELEAFSYSVSHDLSAPLQHIASYSSMVLQDAGPRLDEKNVKHLKVIGTAADRMTGLIEALLELADVSRARFQPQSVNLNVLAEEVFAQLKQNEHGRSADITIAPDMTVQGDPRLLRVVLTNLLGNAWKFTSEVPDARIEFGRSENEAGFTYFVRDNGAGFDMAYASKLFTAFQRLHTRADFEGTGIGLATVKRIIGRHGGKTWAEGVPGKGATFHFTLGGETPATRTEL